MKNMSDRSEQAYTSGAVAATRIVSSISSDPGASAHSAERLSAVHLMLNAYTDDDSGQLATEILIPGGTDARCTQRNHADNAPKDCSASKTRDRVSAGREGSVFDFMLGLW